MRRSVRAYFADIIDACDAITATLEGVDLARYQKQRVIRSAVEREFIIIGEAVSRVRQVDPELARRISHADRVVAFRTQLAHDYAYIEDESVLAIADHDPLS
jgi:uncharacterized protein with HEPN domain